MRKSRLFGQVMQVQGMVVEDVGFRPDPDRREDEVLVVSVRPYARLANRCPECARRCPGYDRADRRRLWRTLDTGVAKTYLEAPAPRVECADHGVVTASVPWARPRAKTTYLLEDTAAWLAKAMALTLVTVFLRLSWRTVQAIVTRVVADQLARTDRMAGLRRIGIDEISYRKGQRYLLCVVDHDTGRLVWAHEGRNQATLAKFFDQLGPERAGRLTHVSSDGAEWIHAVVEDKAPNAVLCLDPFHVVSWAMKALDKVRTQTMAAAGERDRHAIWAVRKNPADLTDDQRESLATIQRTNARLYRAYLLKEQLRAVFRHKGSRGRQLLAGWLSWARHSRLPEFVALARTIDRFKDLIRNTLDHELANALSEATNTHLRALTKRAYGFHTADALIAMATLTRGGLDIKLPGRK